MTPDELRHQGREAERAAVVEYLRQRAAEEHRKDPAKAQNFTQVAALIEAGEHLA